MTAMASGMLRAIFAQTICRRQKLQQATTGH